jgi:hypothetical protein
VAVGAGHGERQAVSCRSGSVAVGRNLDTRAEGRRCPVRSSAEASGLGSPGAVAGAAQRSGVRAAW